MASLTVLGVLEMMILGVHEMIRYDGEVFGHMYAYFIFYCLPIMFFFVSLCCYTHTSPQHTYSSIFFKPQLISSVVQYIPFFPQSLCPPFKTEYLFALC